jgi:hypothetical protein
MGTAGGLKEVNKTKRASIRTVYPTLIIETNQRRVGYSAAKCETWPVAYSLLCVTA